MFRSARDECLRNSAWESRQLGYVEAWKYSNIESRDETNYREGFLADQDVDMWLNQEGIYAPPNRPAPNAKLQGGMRLLICQQSFWRPPGFKMSKEAYLLVEESFHLPPVTLPIFYNDGGSMSRSFDLRREIDGGDDRISLVLKAPQKYQIANFGLSMSYNCRTGFSYGLLYGADVLKTRSRLQEDYAEQSDLIRTFLQDASSMWAQPLVLPCMFLSVHLTRAQTFCKNLAERVRESEAVLGVNRAGRLAHLPGIEDFPNRGPIHETKSSIPVLTTIMSTAMTEIIFTTSVLDWQRDCASFLLDKDDELSKYLPAGVRPQRLKLREYLELLEANSKRLTSYVVALKARMELQLGILYNFVAQIDNRLTAKLAASSSRDSTAMKTLAFMSTLFLPGTFVASIFSTSMFDWQASDEMAQSSNAGVLSRYFWVYWAVTVPLTVIVVICWRLWWAWEKRAFDRDVVVQLEQTEQTKPWLIGTNSAQSKTR